MDAQYEDLETGDDNANAFLNLWSKSDASLRPSEDGDEENKRKPEPTPENEDTEADAERPSDDQDSEGNEGETEADTKEDTEATDKANAQAKKVADDETFVKIKVGEEDHEVKVSDLKRLFGQEKALTQKNMEVAAQRKQLEEQGARQVAAYEAAVGRAKARLQPYGTIDWVQAAVKLAPEEYQNLRSAAQEAYNEVQFYEQGLNGYVQEVQARRNEELVNEARQTLKELADPDKGIKGFNKDVYNEMRAFAMGKGLPEQMVNQIVSAPALRLIHMAMLFEKGQTANTTKVVKTAKKIVKSASSPTKVEKGPAQKAMDKLKKTGSSDDAEAAFLERFNIGSDD